MKARKRAAICLRNIALAVALSLAPAAVFIWVFSIQPIVIEEGNT